MQIVGKSQLAQTEDRVKRRSRVLAALTRDCSTEEQQFGAVITDC